MIDVDKWVAILDESAASREPIGPITDLEPGFSVEDGYAVQASLIAKRCGRGERVVGAKLGLTSKAKQQAMGIDTPIFGVLTDAMQLRPDEPVPLDELIHPRAKPEIAFLMGEDLTGPCATGEDVLDATERICAAFEIIDSRYVDFRFTLSDVVADNTSAARFVLGTTVIDPRTADLTLLGVVLERAGSVIATATGAAILGNPADAIALLANELARRGERLTAGTVVLSGGLTNAEPLPPNCRLEATFAHLGRLDLTTG